MKKRKLDLTELKVTSFVTDVENPQNKLGGAVTLDVAVACHTGIFDCVTGHGNCTGPNLYCSGINCDGVTQNLNNGCTTQPLPTKQLGC